ncbi:sulfate/molybdate ABC transporter ATP-binding protein [Tessaracoccus sp. OH4464_COT-324]|uniref:sulfate/molybdate ABC transporter ATP-binding protein n=1 Tax=Tessaracoccus sp. OH4464_COT-324 TaxID=2491059 RepID=UPI000F62F279|nr:ABC transporter ATP-binding protein [Tessaracoccus sp. OH4464_COT-324]RRD46637.1 ABC transporter ATP-binding protein [Tessaracoccus sp. OH4464_COT-324]
MTEYLQVDARLRDRGLDARLTLDEGEHVAVIGPNGAGKTSLLRLVSGALFPDDGVVQLRGTCLSGPRAHVPVHRRGFAYLEQRPMLFGHLTVLDNVAYGLRARGRPRSVARERALRELELVGAAELATRRPHQLSGGQAQRVALARALATDPDVVLLDEPFAALDVGVAPALRALLRERLAERTVLLVTHEMLDVVSLTSRVVVLDAGRVVADGPVDDVLGKPPTGFVADFTGVNLLLGTAIEESAMDLGGERLVGVGNLRPGARARAAVPPEAVALYREEPQGSPRNCLPARVVSVEPLGRRAAVELDVRGQMLRAELTLNAVAELDLVPGDRVVASIKALQVRLL